MKPLIMVPKGLRESHPQYAKKRVPLGQLRYIFPVWVKVAKTVKLEIFLCLLTPLLWAPQLSGAPTQTPQFNIVDDAVLEGFQGGLELSPP